MSIRSFYHHRIYLLVFGIVFLLASDLYADQQRVRRVRGVPSPPPRATPEPRRHQVSRRNLLQLDRQTPYSLPRPKPHSTQATPQTLRILAIRVDFPPDTTPQTTGTGGFDYRSADAFEQEEGHIIDRAPHDRLYFERHLAAMNAYYEAASYGQFRPTARVIPDGLRASYLLPRQMSYYSPDVDFFDPLKLERLVDFVTDTFAAADHDPAVVFSNYDVFIIFHAGSDLQHDRLQDSPSDLQSGFIRIGDERPPITVDGGAFGIREMVLMPETTSQDGNIGALNVTLAHEFGHQLGLIDLYSTFSFSPGVGSFDLMDQESGTVDIGESGEQIVTGALPTYFGAWSRAFLGWLTPVEVAADSIEFTLLTSGSQANGIKAVRVPIAPGEYFLIENRQTDLDGDGVSFLSFRDGIIEGPSDANKRLNQEYDYLLPGSGVLIWHVDENIARGDFDQNGFSNWEENAMQWDELHRFLDVEEADGIQDLGFTTDAVRAEDLFFVGNNPLFSPETTPDSRHYSGGNSHVTIRVNSVPDLEMDVTVTRRHARTGWPVAAGGPVFTHAPVLTDVNGDRFAETLMVSSDGRLYAWQYDGSKLISNTEVIKTVSLQGDTVTAPAAVFSKVQGAFFTAPAVADLDGDRNLEVITTDAEHVYVWRPVDMDGNGQADLKPGFPIQVIQQSTTGQAERSILTAPAVFRLDSGQSGIVVGTSAGGVIALRHDGALQFSITATQNLNERIITPPAAADLDGDGLDELIVTIVSTGGGRVLVTDILGRTIWTQTTPPVGRASAPLVTDLDGDGRFDVLVAGSDGIITAWDATGAPLSGWPVLMETDMVAPPAAGDLNGDGLPEVVVSGVNRIAAWHGNGIPVTNFPIIIDRANPIGLISSAPALGDLDGDRIPEIIVGLPNGTVTAYHHTGQIVSGFPLGTSGSVRSSPALGDLTGNGDIAIVVGADDGFVHLWTFRGNPDTLPWPMLAHDARRTGASATVAQQPPQVAGDLLVESSVFCYPNPVNGGSTGIRYQLRRNAEVRIRIYTLTGDLVKDISGTGFQNQNEVQWDVGGTVSGVYLCRVEARDSTESQAIFCKIAVVK